MHQEINETKNDTYILTICDGHNASVCLTRNGVVIFAISEERLVRIKNFFGWPTASLDYIANNYIPLEKIDYVNLYREDVTDYLAFIIPEHILNPKYKYLWKKTITRLSLRARSVCNNKIFKKALTNYYANKIGVSNKKISFLNHHKSHAYAAFSEINYKTDKWLHFVLDAEGDGISSSVAINENNHLEFVHKSNRHNSFGHFYSQITTYLGMKPNQHEFKVMGLEPYADRSSKGYKSCFRKFSDLVKFVDGDIKFTVSPAKKEFGNYLLRTFSGERFDNVAAAAQVILEEKVLEYVLYWMDKTNIQKISMSGGVSMNVKLMQRLYECSEVAEIYVVPSSGDESCVLGCANYQALKSGFDITPLESLYLGVERDFTAEVQVLSKQRKDLSFNYFTEIEEEVARLLNSGSVVARVNGRDEFGARALGNRSILANPNNPDVIDLINKQVKNRDFWMPFTPSILDEEKHRLVSNPRSYQARYMNITFNSTETAQSTIPASLHPWDKTVRPQFVVRKQNPTYHKLLSKFYELSGVPGLLNTSFNLHGDPNVSSAADAIDALDRSGLLYLQIGNYLVSKK